VSDRRDRILAAALRVIAARGVDATTHRAVAAEAGVALASTTYHFASKAELVRDALEQAVDRSVSAVERASAPPHEPGTAPLVERLLAFVALLEAEDQAPLAAQFELMLEAGRRPHLRPLAEHWSEAYTAGIERLAAGAGLPDPALAATTISDLIDGALLNQLSLPREDFASARLRPALERTVAGLAAQSRAEKVSQAAGLPVR
jgi:TetR/AcrR family transcriptional regulator, regulator of biofilm formation and stress response